MRTWTRFGPARKLCRAMLMKAPPSMSNDILVRNACEADLGAMLGLYQQLSPQVLVADAVQAPAIWRGLLARPGVTVFVADYDGLASATCTLVIVPNLTRGGRPYALVENVVTRCGLRGRGYGRAVLSAALSRAWDTSCYKAMLLSGRNEDSGVPAFYERLGFRRGVKTGFEARPAPPS